MGFAKLAVTNAAASPPNYSTCLNSAIDFERERKKEPRRMASSKLFVPNLTITESVSP